MMTLNPPPVYNYGMTLAIGIAAKDRIVMAADGKVQDTEKGILNKPKIFQLSKNCVATVSGQQLKGLDEFIEVLKLNIDNQEITGVQPIAEYVTRFASRRTWAQYKDVKKSHIVMMFFGYEQSIPNAYILLSTGKLEPLSLKRYATGNWDKMYEYLGNALKQQSYTTISSKKAERIAVEMLFEGEKANSKDIGGLKA